MVNTQIQHEMWVSHGKRTYVEPVGDLIEALLASSAGEARVHISVLVSLTSDGTLQILNSGAKGLVGGGITGAEFTEAIQVSESVTSLTYTRKKYDHVRTTRSIDGVRKEGDSISLITKQHGEIKDNM